MVVPSLIHVVAAVHAPLMRSLALPNAHAPGKGSRLLLLAYSFVRSIKLLTRILIDAQNGI